MDDLVTEHPDKPAEEPAVEDTGACLAHEGEAALESVERSAKAVQAAATENADGEQAVELPEFGSTPDAGKPPSGKGKR